jgi:hypothetical protein
VKTLAAVQHSAVVVEAVGFAVVEKASGSAVVSSFAVAVFVANLQQPLLVGFVVVVSSDAAPQVVAVVVLQMPHFAGPGPVTCFVHDVAVAAELVLQTYPVAAADLLADSVAVPAVD